MSVLIKRPTVMWHPSGPIVTSTSRSTSSAHLLQTLRSQKRRTWSKSSCQSRGAADSSASRRPAMWPTKESKMSSASCTVGTSEIGGNGAA